MSKIADRIKEARREAGLSQAQMAERVGVSQATISRNGGDLLRLQAILGHASLEMVRRYAHLVASDNAAAHASADPADNWRVK